MVVPPGNEGSDGPQLTSPLPRVAPAPERTGWPPGRRPPRPSRTTGPGGSGSGCAPSTGATPPSSTWSSPLALFVLCSGWVVERSSGAPQPVVRRAALIFPLVFRRRAPMTVFLVIAAVAFVQWLVTGPALADVALLVALYTVALESEWRLVAGRRGDPRSRCRAGHRALEPGRQPRPVLRVPHRTRLHRAAGRGGGAGPAQPARLAGRAGRAAGARARPAGVAGRGDRTGPHRAGDARRGLAQHPGHGHPGRRRLPGAGLGPGACRRGHPARSRARGARR